MVVKLSVDLVVEVLEILVAVAEAGLLDFNEFFDIHPLINKIVY